MWGPAEFVGLPPRWLVAEGLLAGALGVAATAGAGAAGVWTGWTVFADGEAGLVCAGALAVYLAFVRAGRALVGIVAAIGACLAVQTPQMVAGIVLADRGRVESMVVTEIDEGHRPLPDRSRHLCSVTDEKGVPLAVPIWRGCDRSTRPGDVLPVVYDPKGRVRPQGVQTGTAGTLDVAALSAALAAVSMVAVVRSYRLPHPTGEPSRATTGADTRDSTNGDRL
ncbi:hypothetical protein ACGFSG_24300 [Streptomyces sp. NPDC048512]|uniref:hypothetical protein n=1 Tax=Streptomyces sp. NPDC048512 TaxID=3365563 RepID=UPI00371470C0